MAALRKEGHSLRTIAEVSHSTLSRELRKNSYGTGGRTPPGKIGSYDPSYAQARAYVRRKQSKFQGMKIEQDQALRTYVIQGLMHGWNPDEIAGYLKRHQACLARCSEDGCGLAYASKTAIYEWLRSGYGQPFCQYLPSHQHRIRKRRNTAVPKVLIPERVSIDQRPVAATNRTQYGHWEGDTMVSGKKTGSKAALAVFIERKTRFMRAHLIPDLKPEHFAAAATNCLSSKKTLTLTLDNGLENRRHRDITSATGADIYFCDPYSSWQKGGIENANRMLRRYIPKGCDLGTVDQAVVEALAERVNNKPRKILGYKSAVQLAHEKGVITSRTGGALRG